MQTHMQSPYYIRVSTRCCIKNENKYEKMEVCSMHTLVTFLSCVPSKSYSPFSMATATLATTALAAAQACLATQHVTSSIPQIHINKAG